MILADENIDFRIIEAIRNIPVGVFSVAEECPGISDEEVIKISKNPPRLILTEDKDFGEWVFAHHEDKISVIFLRYHHNNLDKIINILINHLKFDTNNYWGRFTTITTKNIRIRKLT